MRCAFENETNNQVLHKIKYPFAFPQNAYTIIMESLKYVNHLPVIVKIKKARHRITAGEFTIAPLLEEAKNK